MNLTVNDLSYTYRGGHTALQNVSFTARQGELLSVLGPNGAGKSTLFRCILGGLPDYGGAILLDGRDARTLEQRALAAHIAYIPQIHRPTFGYSVLDTALMGLTRQLSPFRSPSAAQEEQAMAALERMGVAQLARRSFSELSGGERQKVAIARALAQEPRLLVLDEPTGNLDVSNEHLLMREAKKAAQERHIAVLSSLHDLNQALAFGDRFFFLKDGVIRYAVTREAVTEDVLCDVFGAALRLREVDGTRVVLHGPAD